MQILDLPLLVSKSTRFLMFIFRTKSQFFFKLCITHQCHETLLFCTFSSEILYAWDKRSSSKCKFSDFWLIAWKLTKFCMSFFVPWVTKIAHQFTIFQTFECSNESSPNLSCQFWNHKVRVYLNFASLFSTWNVTPL